MKMKKIIEFFKVVIDVLFGPESHSEYRYEEQQKLQEKTH